MAKHKSSSDLSRDFSRLALLLQVSGVYFLVTAGLAFLVERAALPLLNADGTPTLWLWLIWFFYYVGPFALAAVFGILFRPFWKNFFRLYIFLLVMQFSVSLVGYGLREEIARRQKKDEGRSRLVSLRFHDFSHRFSDENRDGRVDKIDVTGECDTDNFPAGVYILNVDLQQEGVNLPASPVFSLEQRITRPAPQHFKLQFHFNLEILDDFLSRGEIQIVLSLLKKIELSAQERHVIRWSQFAPFLRSVPWGKEDPLLPPEMVDLEIRQTVDAFHLLPLESP